MASNYHEWYMQLYDERLNAPIDDDAGLYVVLTGSDPTRLTAYSDSSGTSLTQPATMTNGVIQFWLDSATTSVDISVLTNAGRAYFLEGVSKSTHKVCVHPEKQEYQFVCEWNGNTACDAVADTGFDLLKGMRVKDVFVHITTVTTATAIDVGISGDTDAFYDACTTSVTGFKFSNVVLISNETASLSIVAAAQNRGLELRDFATGFSATVTAGGSRGMFERKFYNVTAATSLVYIVKETNSGGTGEGYLYIEYDILPTSGN